MTAGGTGYARERNLAAAHLALVDENTRLQEERDRYRAGFEKAEDALDAQIRNDAVVEMERNQLRTFAARVGHRHDCRGRDGNGGPKGRPCTCGWGDDEDEGIRALTDPATGETTCEHNWADARNEAVQSGEVCTKCSAIRAPPTTEGGSA
jgi:hypothetical protein